MAGPWAPNFPERSALTHTANDAERGETELAGESILSLNDIQLTFYDSGVGSRAIVLIHGHPFNHTMWQPQAEFLKSKYRVVVPDLLGYGKSLLPDGKRETRLETFAADNLALAAALGVRKFVLAGHSMGGQIVLEMLRQAPERIEALLLADTFSGLDSPERKQWRFDMADRLEREGMAAYAKEEITKMITPDNAEQFPEVAAHVMKMMTTTPPSGAAAALRGRAQRVDYTSLLRDIRVPTLVVVGSEDVYTPVAMAEQLRDGIPGAELAVIEGAGHMPNVERPDAFNAALGTWMRGLG